MVVFTYTLPVNDATDGDQPAIALDDLWECLVAKARNPVPFVPSITEAAVTDEFEGGFNREIVLRDVLKVRERITLEPRRRVVFEQLDNPDLSFITNEIGTDGAGHLTFTFTAALSPAGVEKSRRDDAFIVMNDLLFYDTAQAEVSAIRLTARANKAPAPSDRMESSRRRP
jgi:hypothetical protein